MLSPYLPPPPPPIIIFASQAILGSSFVLEHFCNLCLQAFFFEGHGLRFQKPVTVTIKLPRNSVQCCKEVSIFSMLGILTCKPAVDSPEQPFNDGLSVYDVCR